METKKVSRTLGIVFLAICFGYIGYNAVSRFMMQVLLERENYNPLDVDEESCSELIKVDNCLNAFFRDFPYDKSLDEYLWGSYVPDAEPEGIREIKNYAYHAEFYGSKADYDFYIHKPQMTYEEAKEWAGAIALHKIWYADLRRCLEYYLYGKCKSKLVRRNIVLSSSTNAGILDEQQYVRQAKEQIAVYFNRLHAPEVGEAELLDDDRKEYEVWNLYKVADTEGEAPTKVVVLYDSKGRRNGIRLFHPRWKKKTAGTGRESR